MNATAQQLSLPIKFDALQYVPPPTPLVLLPPTPPTFLMAEQNQARQNAEAWQDAQPDKFAYMALDRMCEKCMYVCKNRWRFAGLPKKSGEIYLVGPLCEVLWKFNPSNPLVWRRPM